MKWIDNAGYKHLSLIRDNDPMPDAKRPGILQDPPDLQQLDWEGIVKEIHNLLIDRGLITWPDVQASGNGVSAVILTILRRQIITLYKLDSK